MPASRYSDYESGGSTSNERADDELIVTPYAEVEAEITSVFGTQSEYGQSLATVFNDVELIDGCLYYDPEKQKFKLFSWKSSNDMEPAERYEREGSASAEDASEFIRKTYFGNDKDYELIAARVPEIVDDDGEVLVESSSRTRSVDTETGEYAEWQDLGGDPVPVRDVISWFDGNSEAGASTTARVLAQTLTEYGDLAVEDEDDIDNWLHDTTAENVMRDDLEGQRVRFFVVRREGDEYTYSLPIVESADSGVQYQPDNRIGESEQAQEAAEQDDTTSGEYPEPIDDFVTDAGNLSMDEGRAEKLLTDLIEDDDSPLTQAMVEDHGGFDSIINEVV